MPKGTNQKFKLYRLAQIMLKETDEDHFITLPEIQKALGRTRSQRTGRPFTLI